MMIIITCLFLVTHADSFGDWIIKHKKNNKSLKNDIFFYFALQVFILINNYFFKIKKEKIQWEYIW